MQTWTIQYDGFDQSQERQREALCTLGNGYLAARGAAEEAPFDVAPHYPGTYLAGGYNRRVSRVHGRSVENEDLVNWPNWLPLTFRVEGEEWHRLDAVEVLAYTQTLDLRRGVLERRRRFRDHHGRTSTLESRRLVSMTDPHRAAIEWLLIPEDWSGDIQILGALDGRVENVGVERYRELESKHLEVLDAEIREDVALLRVRTTQSRLEMVQAARMVVEGRFHCCALCEDERVGLIYAGPVQQGQPVRVEKHVAVYTSRDRALSEPSLAAHHSVTAGPDWNELLASHACSWRRLWRRCDLEVDGPVETQRLARLHIFHMLQTVGPHAAEQDKGIPARGLHGEAYRGHIFWDELFMVPLLVFCLPEAVRSSLLYRYRRLAAARDNATRAGFHGALFPWQSGSDGREESQTVHLNPLSNRWIRDNTYRQRHINAAIAYNIWAYFQVTGDIEFMVDYGTEMLLEIARLFSSLSELRPDGRYGIRGVVGPDEYHTAYPGTDAPGIDNNAYTNVMAAWCLEIATNALERLPQRRRDELREFLQLADQELARWGDISRRMFVPFLGNGVVAQFEGFDRLEEVDWEGLRQRHGDIQRLDRVLEAEADSPNRYQASKQADVLMLLYLFSADELEMLFDRLGYRFDRQDIPRTIEHYAARTSHGSTLSRVVHAWVLARQDRQASWHWLGIALRSDFADIQGGTTEEGVHLGAMAGTTDLLRRCYLGIVVDNGTLWFNPRLPKQLRSVRTRLRFLGHWLSVTATHENLRVDVERGASGNVVVGFEGTRHTLTPGEQVEFALGRSMVAP